MIVYFCYSTDEGITENLLKAMQTYIGLCGLLDMQEPRNAFITAICRACLPPNYNLTIFSSKENFCSAQQQSSMSYTSVTNFDDQMYQEQCNTTSNTYGSENADYKQFVVAVGTPLATPSSVFQQTSSSSGETTCVTYHLLQH